MENFSVKINLSRLNGIKKMKAKSGAEFICIPIKENYLFEGRTGLFLNLSAFVYKEQKYKDTHYLKNEIPKEIFIKMNDEEKKTPIIGTLTPFNFNDNIPMANAGEFEEVSNNNKIKQKTDILGENDDLPF